MLLPSYSSLMKVVFIALSSATVCNSFYSQKQSVVVNLRPNHIFEDKTQAYKHYDCCSLPVAARAKLFSARFEDGVPTDLNSSSSALDKKKFLLAGIELSPELIAILTVYFVQGALGLSRLAVSFYMKDELHLSPTDMAAIGGITSLPWLIKPLYGFLSDGIPIFGYKRRSYLIIAGIIGCLSWLALGTVVTDTASAVAAITLGSASVAVSDVVADSITVEKSRLLTQQTIPVSFIMSNVSSSSSSSVQKTLDVAGSAADAEYSIGAAATSDSEGLPVVNVAAGDLQSLCWSAAAVGGILSAYFSGSLLQTVTPKTVFLLTAVFPLLISAASFLIDEKAEIFRPSIKEFTSTVTDQLTTLKDTLINPKIFLPVLFIFAWQATPTPDSAMFFFTTGELGFGPEFLGRVRLAASLAALCGVTIYRTFLKDVSIKKVVLWTSLLSVPLSLTQLMLVTHYNRVLGIPDQVFALTDTVVLTVLGQIAFMPTLVLASTLCPPRIEGTLFATLMSIYNGAGTVASELGALLTSSLGVTEKNFDNLPMLVLLCSLGSLLPLPFINVLDKTLSGSEPPTESDTSVVITEIVE